MSGKRYSPEEIGVASKTDSRVAQLKGALPKTEMAQLNADPCSARATIWLIPEASKSRIILPSEGKLLVT